MILNVEFKEINKGFNVGFGELTDLNMNAFNAGYGKGFEDGKNSVEDFARYATSVQFEDLNLFGKEEVVLNLDNATSLYNFHFTDAKEPKPPANTTVKRLTINCPNKVTSIQHAFGRMYVYDKCLEHLTLNVDTSEASGYADYFLANLDAVKVIDGQPLNFSNISRCLNAIRGMAKLEEIRFVEKSIPSNIIFAYCPMLSGDSIQSIIDGLKDLSGGTAQKITLHTNAVLDLTDEQITQIVNKNWEIG